MACGLLACLWSYYDLSIKIHRVKTESDVCCSLPFLYNVYVKCISQKTQDYNLPTICRSNCTMCEVHIPPPKKKKKITNFQPFADLTVQCMCEVHIQKETSIHRCKNIVLEGKGCSQCKPKKTAIILIDIHAIY